MKFEDAPSTTSQPASGGDNASQLNDKIKAQGDKVRDLKGKKADKATIGEAVAVLLALKEEFKKATGQDWKPGMEMKKEASPAPASNNDSALMAQLNEDVKAQGDKVRNLKSQKADKAMIDEAVKVLLALKEKFKRVAGKIGNPV